jgi:hypothetical protein
MKDEGGRMKDGKATMKDGKARMKDEGQKTARECGELEDSRKPSTPKFFR